MGKIRPNKWSKKYLILIFELKKTFPDYYKYYGRRIAKRLSPSLNNIFTKNYYRFSLDEEIISNLQHKLNYNLKLNTKFKKNIIEIGFGDGKHLFELAKSNKDHYFIGCEVFINGLGKILKKIIDYNLENISLCGLNCIYLLNNIDDFSIDQIYIINPDPWEKKRHFKRRLLNKEFISLLYKKIKKGGNVLITTDSLSYYEAISKTIKMEKIEFEHVEAKLIDKGNKFYNISKYQKKGIEEGRKIYLIRLNKI